MRSIEEQLNQILRSGVATVQTDDGFGHDRINTESLEHFYPAIDPSDLYLAWYARSKTGSSLPAHERCRLYLEWAINGYIVRSGLPASKPENATLVRTAVMVNRATKQTEAQPPSEKAITVTVSSAADQTPATLTTRFHPDLTPPVQRGDVIRLKRDQNERNTRLGMVLEVDQLSKNTLMLTVWWYRTSGNQPVDMEATWPPEACEKATAAA